MTIRIRDLCFGYGGDPLFDRFSADLGDGGAGRPLVILGPSGCGKTTLLKLLGGLLEPQSGEINFSGKAAFMFQESRLLPWFTVLENIAIPLEKDFGKEEARAVARRFLALVFLAEKEAAFPADLSGGQAQRVSMARAFAWPAQALFMDEPFQSLDISLRLNLMDMCLSLNKVERRLFVAVTHDPREAIYMGSRIIIMGGAGRGIVFDRTIDLAPEDRSYGSPRAAELEREMIQCLSAT